MPDSQYGARHWNQVLSLRQIVPLLGAMLVCVVLLGAAASNASAEPVGLFIAGAKSEEAAKQPKFEAEKYSATISSKALSSFVFTAEAGKLKCSEFALPGTISGATNQLKFQQIFWPCTFAGFATTITANGCEFVLHVLNAGPPYVGTTDIVCPAGKKLEFTAWASGEKVCTLGLSPQTGVEGVSFENTGAGSARAVNVNFNLTGVKYSQTPGFAPLCKAGEYTNGTFVVSDSLIATK